MEAGERHVVRNQRAEAGVVLDGREAGEADGDPAEAEDRESGPREPAFHPAAREADQDQCGGAEESRAEPE